MIGYSVVDGNDVSLDTNNFNYRVNIFFFGLVVWSPFFTWVTSCELDVQYFPFDEQACSVQFMHWVYTPQYVNYTLVTGNNVATVDTSAIQNSSDWDLVSTSSGIYNALSAYPLVYFKLTLRRVPYYFIFNIILPTVCLSALSSLVFLVPPEAGEKIGLTVTLLMSYSVILLMMADNVPRSSTLPIVSK